MKHTKPALRDLYLKKRMALSMDEHQDLSFSVANECLKLPIWDYQYFHLFLPMTSKAEIDSSLVLTLLQGRDKEVILPKVIDDLDLQHILLTDSTRIETNAWKIPEPIQGIPFDPKLLDVIFIPLLICDLRGHRVGYGKGYYDRFLKECRPESLKIGLSFFDPIPLIEDIYEGDIPLDYCVCPEKTHKF